MIQKKINSILLVFIWVLFVISLTAMFFTEDSNVQIVLLLLLPPLSYSAFFTLRLSWFLLGPLTDLIFFVALKRIFLVGEIDNRLNIIFLGTIMILLICYPVSELFLTIKRTKDSEPYFKEISEAKFQTGPLIFNETALQNSKMTESEQNFFRTEMKKHHKNYEYLCDVSPDVKLMLPTFPEDMKVMDGIFRELLNAPVQFLTASDFLYQDLPDYVELIRATENVLDNVIKDDNDKKILAEVPSKVALISNNLKEDLKKITDNERKELKKQLKQVELERNTRK